ncbi:unnamed protein product [Rotaria sordida]|uniref:Uncharacterized protein n=1 Tax=Rotaria sordida TaxID=392033 RepID=A0A820L421_9BILA|nr:unnamed protein product [Rotaria sordida]
MRLLMNEFTSLYNYLRSVQSNISNAMFIACTHDGYVLCDGIPHMTGFHHAAAEMLQRQESNVKLKKNI